MSITNANRTNYMGYAERGSNCGTNSAEYCERERNTENFLTAQTNTNCCGNGGNGGNEGTTDECGEHTDMCVEGCGNGIEIDAGNLDLTSSGTMVNVKVKLRNVCPNKRVALAALLTELDSEENEYNRGFKTMTVPAHNYNTPRNITVNSVRFVLPEDLALETANENSSSRRVRVRVIAHYIDIDNTDCSCNDN